MKMSRHRLAAGLALATLVTVGVALAQSVLRSWQTPNSTGFPAEPNVASGAGYAVQTGWLSGLAVYVESTGQLAANGPCGPGGLCPPGSSFWRVSSWPGHSTDFNDARAVWWSVYGRWVLITLDASSLNTSQSTPTPFDIAISPGSDPTVASSQWIEYQIPGGCPSNGPRVDFPRIGTTQQWLVVVHNCLDSSNVVQAGKVHAIEASSVLNGGVPADHVWAAPNFIGVSGTVTTHDTPVDQRSSTTDSIAYLGAWIPGAVMPGTNLNISTIIGAQSSPQLCPNVFTTELCCIPVGGGACISGGSCTISQIHPNGQIPPIPADGSKWQVGCLNYNNGKAIGDEDTWTNGDRVLEFVEDEAYGAQQTTTHCNSPWTTAATVYEAIDTHQIGTSGCSVPNWTPVSFFLRTTSGGADAEAYPAVSHLVSGGSDYVGFTDSHSTTSLNPTMVAAVYRGNGNPLTGVQAQLLNSFNIKTSDSGSSNATYKGRWGDYAGAWPSSSGFFDLSSNLYLGGKFTGYAAEVTP